MDNAYPWMSTTYDYRETFLLPDQKPININQPTGRTCKKFPGKVALHFMGFLIGRKAYISLVYTWQSIPQVGPLPHLLLGPPWRGNRHIMPRGPGHHRGLYPSPLTQGNTQRPHLKGLPPTHQPISTLHH